MAHRADNMSKASTALKKVADAGAPLYQSLNDDQKARFVKLGRMLRPHHHMHADNGRGGQQGLARATAAAVTAKAVTARGWGHGRRFGQNGGFGKMQNLSDDNGDQGSQL